MSRINVSEEALQVLRDTSAQVEEIHRQLTGFSKNLDTAFNDNCLGLGAHYGDIDRLLKTLAETSSDEKEVNRLVKKISVITLTMAAHIANSLYSQA